MNALVSESNRLMDKTEPWLAAVVSSMNAHAGDSFLQHHAFLLIAHADFSEETLASSSIFDCVESVLRAMERHSNAEYVQLYGCRSLLSLAVSEEVEAKIASCGGVAAVVHAMQYHPTCLDTQINACAVLEIFSVSEAHWPANLTSSCVNSVSNALGCFSSNHDMQLRGCNLLKRFCRFSGPFRSTVVRGHGLDSVVAVMRSNPNSSILQSTCCAVLADLAQAAKLRPRLASAANLVRQANDSFPANSELVKCAARFLALFSDTSDGSDTALQEAQTLRCNCCKAEGAKFKRCSRCLRVRYCGSVCQKRDWTEHKHNCKQPDNVDP